MTKNVKFFQRDQLVDISNDTCIPPLLNGMNSSCQITHGYHIPQIETISPGIIFLNDFSGTVNNKSLNGTFLIEFQNVTLRINDKFYEFYIADVCLLQIFSQHQIPINFNEPKKCISGS